MWASCGLHGRPSRSEKKRRQPVGIAGEVAGGVAGEKSGRAAAVAGCGAGVGTGPEGGSGGRGTSEAPGNEAPPSSRSQEGPLVRDVRDPSAVGPRSVRDERSSQPPSTTAVVSFGPRWSAVFSIN